VTKNVICYTENVNKTVGMAGSRVCVWVFPAKKKYCWLNKTIKFIFSRQCHDILIFFSGWVSGGMAYALI